MLASRENKLMQPLRKSLMPKLKGIKRMLNWTILIRCTTTLLVRGGLIRKRIRLSSLVEFGKVQAHSQFWKQSEQQRQVRLKCLTSQNCRGSRTWKPSNRWWTKQATIALTTRRMGARFHNKKEICGIWRDRQPWCQVNRNLSKKYTSLLRIKDGSIRQETRLKRMD